MRPIIAALASLLIAAASYAAVPQMINFQGQLSDNLGNPVADGSYSVVFTIYDAASGGNSVWTETQNVNTTGGQFAILLGSVTPVEDSVFKQPDRWLGIQVGADPEMAPRTKLVSVGYSFRTNSVDGALGGTIQSKVTIGPHNQNTGTDAFVAGYHCVASGNYSVVSGGGSLSSGGGNTASGMASAIGGGQVNHATSSWDVVAGGNGNTASGGESFVGGGAANVSGANLATVGGGSLNHAYGIYSTVAGGNSNYASGKWSAVCGGNSNSASGENAFIGCGGSNEAAGAAAVVGGGGLNSAGGEYSTVSGGLSNSASGYRSTVAGGFSCSATARYSYAAGYSAHSIHDYSMVLSCAGSSISSSAADQFTVSAPGGTRIFSSGTSAGVTLAPGASAWASVSDSTMKDHIREVDYEEVLERVEELPISRWSYKAQSDDIEHIGPMAQDFYRLFKLGEDNRHISTLDPDGVSLAAIKALHHENEELEQENKQLKSRLDRLESMMAKLSAR